MIRSFCCGVVLTLVVSLMLKPTMGLANEAIVLFSPYVMLSVMAAFGSWSIMTILMALCFDMLSHTQTHCAHPLHRSTAT